MGTPHEDLAQMRQIRDLLEKAHDKAQGITPRASTIHGPPDPHQVSPLAVFISNATEHADQEIETLERITNAGGRQPS